MDLIFKVIITSNSYFKIKIGSVDLMKDNSSLSLIFMNIIISYLNI